MSEFKWSVLRNVGIAALISGSLIVVTLYGAYNLSGQLQNVSNGTSVSNSNTTNSASSSTINFTSSSATSSSNSSTDTTTTQSCGVMNDTYCATTTQAQGVLNCSVSSSSSALSDSFTKGAALNTTLWTPFSWGPNANTSIGFNSTSGINISEATTSTWSDYGIVSRDAYSLNNQELCFGMNVLSGIQRYDVNLYLAPAYSTNSDPYRNMDNWIGITISGNYEWGYFYGQVTTNESGVVSGWYNQLYTGNFPAEWVIDFFNSSNIVVSLDGNVVYSTSSAGLNLSASYHLYLFESTNDNSGVYTVAFPSIVLGAPQVPLRASSEACTSSIFLFSATDSRKTPR